LKTSIGPAVSRASATKIPRGSFPGRGGRLGSGLAGRAEQVDPFLDDVLDRVDDRSDDLDDRVLVWVGLELCF
jgi:hypothetical protein